VPDILITGGSDGIGLAVARLLTAEGDTRVTLVARNEAKLEEAVVQLSGDGHDFIAADLSTPKGMDLVDRRLAARHYDVLINNAGAGLYGRFAELSLDDQLRMMRLNVESVSVLSHAYLRRARPGDALVNTASFLAYAPLPGSAAYSATKAFVAALSEALWWESKKDGIYVLCFSPGVIATGFHSEAGSSVATFPRLLVQSPDSAARELAAALGKRGNPRLIAGFATRQFVRLQQLVGRKTAINMMGRSSPLQPPAQTRALDEHRS
jgi:short-subunit dehydrogenase